MYYKGLLCYQLIHSCLHHIFPANPTSWTPIIKKCLHVQLLHTCHLIPISIIGNLSVCCVEQVLLQSEGWRGGSQTVGVIWWMYEALPAFYNTHCLRHTNDHTHTHSQHVPRCKRSGLSGFGFNQRGCQHLRVKAYVISSIEQSWVPMPSHDSDLCPWQMQR